MNDELLRAAVTPVQAGTVRIGAPGPLAVIAGPCVLESTAAALEIAETAKTACDRLGLPYVFKASFDKANRTSVDSARGPGLEEGLAMLAEVKQRLGVPVTTDVHAPDQCPAVAQVADLLQIPAFLCRQTDLVLAAAATGKPLNIKKGQFMAPWDMQGVVDKCRRAGNDRVLLTERGVSFGYNTLVSDLRALAQMRALGCPVCFDATHSVQQPGGLGTASGGRREFVPLLARAATAAGCDALFLETHPRPETSPSDAASLLPLDRLAELLAVVAEIHDLVWSRARRGGTA